MYWSFLNSLSDFDIRTTLKDRYCWCFCQRCCPVVWKWRFKRWDIIIFQSDIQIRPNYTSPRTITSCYLERVYFFLVFVICLVRLSYHFSLFKHWIGRGLSLKYVLSGGRERGHPKAYKSVLEGGALFPKTSPLLFG